MMNSHTKNTKIIISTLNFVKIIHSVLIHMAKMTADASLHHQYITFFQGTVLTYMYMYHDCNSSNKHPSSSFQGKKVIKFSLPLKPPSPSPLFLITLIDYIN